MLSSFRLGYDPRLGLVVFASGLATIAFATLADVRGRLLLSLL